MCPGQKTGEEENQFLAQGTLDGLGPQGGSIGEGKWGGAGGRGGGWGAQERRYRLPSGTSGDKDALFVSLSHL